jgi:hypothetical protein
MKSEPPDLETCKTIVNSAELRSEHSFKGTIGRLAIACVFILFAFTNRECQWIDGTPYLNLRSILGLSMAIIYIRIAYLRAFGTKDGHVLTQFATYYINNHYAEAAKQRAEQAVPPNGP